jgi:hypothetical protein
MGWVQSFVAILVLIGAWVLGFPPVPLAITSLVSLIYFLFFAPADCRAEGRQGPCRNNAHGLLLACHIEQHKRQKLWMLLPGRNFYIRVKNWWVNLRRALWDTPRQCLDTFGTIVSILSSLAAFLKVLWELVL